MPAVHTLELLSNGLVATPLAYTASAWTQIIVAISIFGPVAVAVAITVAVLRGSKNDPDERRWKREAAQREQETEQVSERRVPSPSDGTET